MQSSKTLDRMTSASPFSANHASAGRCCSWTTESIAMCGWRDLPFYRGQDGSFLQVSSRSIAKLNMTKNIATLQALAP